MLTLFTYPYYRLLMPFIPDFLDHKIGSSDLFGCFVGVKKTELSKLKLFHRETFHGEDDILILLWRLLTPIATACLFYFTRLSFYAAYAWSESIQFPSLHHHKCYHWLSSWEKDFIQDISDAHQMGFMVDKKLIERVRRIYPAEFPSPVSGFLDSFWFFFLAQFLAHLNDQHHILSTKLVWRCWKWQKMIFDMEGKIKILLMKKTTNMK